MKRYTNSFELIYGAGVEANIMQMKSRALIMLTSLINDKNATRKEIAEFLGVSTSEVSNIMTGKLGTMSFEKLFKHLHKFGVVMRSDLNVQEGKVISCSINLESKECCK